MTHVSSFNYTHPMKKWIPLKCNLLKIDLGLKVYIFEDQVQLMKEYLKYGSMPFECMNHSQKNDFKQMASHYKYVPTGDKLIKNVITKKKKRFNNESECL